MDSSYAKTKFDIAEHFLKIRYVHGDKAMIRGQLADYIISPANGKIISILPWGATNTNNSVQVSFDRARQIRIKWQKNRTKKTTHKDKWFQKKAAEKGKILTGVEKLEAVFKTWEAYKFPQKKKKKKKKKHPRNYTKFTGLMNLGAIIEEHAKNKSFKCE